MKNYEKYADEIRGYSGDNFCKDFVEPYILKSDKCNALSCDVCNVIQTIWLLEDYKEPEEPKTDWSKVEVDTPVLVRDGENNEWQRSYFAKYEDGFVYTWIAGATSWTAVGYEKGGNVYRWNYAKLAEDEKKGKEPEVDWNKVEVDTPILVKEYEDGEWVKRYFAKYIAGKVYAWNGGRTGQTESHVTPWKYAKLAETEDAE